MTWTVTLEHDGHPMAMRVPIDDWDLAALIAPLFALMAGATVSVALAVHRHRTTIKAA